MMMTAIVAMAFYAIEITIADLKLSHIPPQLMTFFYASGIAVISFISVISNRENFVRPDAVSVGFILLMIFVSFIAASAHYQSIYEGIGSARLSLAYACLPVTSLVLVTIIKKEIPSFNLILACILAGIALYLVSLSHSTES
jgi:drug/metabolite transporter (DMT)-like permease